MAHHLTAIVQARMPIFRPHCCTIVPALCALALRNKIASTDVWWRPH